MTIMDAHKIVARVAGEMALAIVRREAADDVLRAWIDLLRTAADGLQRRLPANAP